MRPFAAIPEAALFAGRAPRIARRLRMDLFDAMATRSSALLAIGQPYTALAPPAA